MDYSKAKTFYFLILSPPCYAWGFLKPESGEEGDSSGTAVTCPEASYCCMLVCIMRMLEVKQVANSRCD